MTTGNTERRPPAAGKPAFCLARQEGNLSLACEALSGVWRPVRAPPIQEPPPLSMRIASASAFGQSFPSAVMSDCTAGQ